MRSHLLFLIFSFTILLSSCYDNIDNTTNTEILEQPEIRINTEIAGLIEDSNDSNVSGYTLRISGTSYNVSHEFFSIYLEDVNKLGQGIEVYKDQRLIGFEYATLIENDLNLIELLQFEDLSERILSTTENSTLTLNTDTGLDILNSELSIMMPLENSTIGSQLRYGFVNVDLPLAYTNRNQLLKPLEEAVFYVDFDNQQLSNNMLNEPMKIMLSNARAEQSLFRYDANLGKWLELTKLRDGEVSLDMIRTGLFAIGNADFAVAIEGTTITENNKIVSYQPIEVAHGTSIINKKSSLNGHWLAIVPQLTDLEVGTKSPCGDVGIVYPISVIDKHLKDQNLIVNQDAYFYHAQGAIVDCEGGFLTNPLLSLITENTTLNYFINESLVNYNFPICSSEFDISAINIVDNNQGPVLPWNIEDELSYLSSCDAHDNGFSFLSIRDDKKVYNAFTARQEDNNLIIESDNQDIKIIIEGMQEGVYGNDEVNIKIDDSNFGNSGYFMACENPDFECGITECKVSHYREGEQEWVRVILSGELWMQTLNPSQAGNFETQGAIVCRFM